MEPESLDDGWRTTDETPPPDHPLLLKTEYGRPGDIKAGWWSHNRKAWLGSSLSILLGVTRWKMFPETPHSEAEKALLLRLADGIASEMLGPGFRRLHITRVIVEEIERRVVATPTQQPEDTDGH